MAENGRPTELTEELTLRIRSMVLEGKRYSEVQRELDISPNTWDTWVYKDYQDFRKNLNSWKAERLIKKSEKISEEILDMENVTAELLRIKQKEAEFVRETLGKQEYSKRSELTGKDGKDLIPTQEKRTMAEEAIKQFLDKDEQNTADTIGERPANEESAIPIQPTE